MQPVFGPRPDVSIGQQVVTITDRQPKMDLTIVGETQRLHIRHILLHIMQHGKQQWIAKSELGEEIGLGTDILK